MTISSGHKAASIARNFLPNLGKMKAFMLLIAAVMSLGFSSPVMAQAAPPPSPPADSGGGIFDFGNLFNLKNNADGFGDRREVSLELLKSYDCMSCQIFNSFASAVFSGLDKANSAGPSLIPVLTGFASLFALFYLGSAFVAGDASDLVGRWQVFWRLCLAVAVGSWILTSPVTIMWDLCYSILFEIGNGVVNSVGGGGGNSVCNGASLITPTGIPAGASSVLTNMSTTVCGAYNMTLEGIANGMAMATQKDGVINTLVYVVAGLFVMAIYGFIALTFPLRFIDVVIKLAIVSMITPILIVAAVFKPTRGYIGIAISNVLNATAQFAILTILFKIGTQVFADVAKLTIQSSAGTTEPVGIMGGSQDFTAVLVQAMMLIGVAVVFNGLIKSVPAIAAEFSRSSGGGGDAGGAAAVGMVSRTGTVSSKAAGTVSRAAVGRVAGAASKIGKTVA